MYDEKYIEEWLKVTERVNQGADWLDEQVPGWYDKIDTSTLDISSGQRCICGQLFMQSVNNELYSGYDFVIEFLMNDVHERINHGFSADHLRQWDMLGEAWVQKIQKRRAEAGTMMGDI